jgi:hypothetical protein
MSTIELSDTQRQILTYRLRAQGRLRPSGRHDREGRSAQEGPLQHADPPPRPGSACPSVKQQVWRTGEDGTPLTLKVTKAAHEAVGTKQRKGRAAPGAKVSRKQRCDSKQAKGIAMLKRPNGATVEEIMAETEWQAHTVRGFFAGALKKRLGLEVTSEKVEDRGRVYRIASA